MTRPPSGEGSQGRLQVLRAACVLALAASPTLAGGDPWIAELLEEGRHEQALREVAERLAHDPVGEVASSAVQSLRPALPRYRPSAFEAYLRRARRSKGRRVEDVFLYLEALRRLTPTPDGYHDPGLGHDYLRQVGTRSKRPVVAGLALFELARELSRREPARAARFLETLEASPRHRLPPLGRAQAALLRVVCLDRAGETEEALRVVRDGLAAHGSTPHPEGGTLEPYFRHSMADLLRRRGETRAAARQLQGVLATGDAYPARAAARRELEAL